MTIGYQANSLPPIPGFREALNDWLRDHDINPDLVISFEVSEGEPGVVNAVIVALNADGKPYPEPGTDELATDITGAAIKRPLPKPEDFEPAR